MVRHYGRLELFDAQPSHVCTVAEWDALEADAHDQNAVHNVNRAIVAHFNKTFA
jgi:hypothetical protein